MKRISQLDYLRGFAILYVVLAHTTIYTYADFNGLLTSGDLTPHLVILGIVALWGGLFALLSSLTNTLSILSNTNKEGAMRAFFSVVAVGLLYLIGIGLAHSLLLGRWEFAGSGETHYPLVIQMLRGQDILLSVDALRLGSGITMIGFNLIVLGLVLGWLYTKNKIDDTSINYTFFAVIGVCLLALSSLRVLMLDPWLGSIQTGDTWLQLFLSPIMQGPYPIAVYLSYGFLGVLLGMCLHHKKIDYLKKIIIPISLVFTILGVTVMTQLQPAFLSISWEWYVKFITETSFFVLVLSLVITRLIRTENRTYNKTKELPSLPKTILIKTSKISLTIYIFETLIAELLRLPLLAAFPDFENNLLATFGMGVVHVLLWVMIATLWSRVNYKYSVEYCIIQFVKYFGKSSNRLS